MFRLADLRISTKVMLVVALLSAIAAGIAAISIRSLNTMNTVADRMTEVPTMLSRQSASTLHSSASARRFIARWCLRRHNARRGPQGN